MVSCSVPPGTTFPAALLISLGEVQSVCVDSEGGGGGRGGGEGEREREEVGGRGGCNLFSTPLEMNASFGCKYL